MHPAVLNCAVAKAILFKVIVFLTARTNLRVICRRDRTIRWFFSDVRGLFHDQGSHLTLLSLPIVAERNQKVSVSGLGKNVVVYDLGTCLILNKHL